jgi:conjugal transfer/type IV secretion protein DotA/TraY
MPTPNDLLNQPVLESDYSKQLLDAVFGTGWDKISQAVQGGAVSEGANLILALLQGMNAVALSFTVVLMVWTTVQGVVGTAHEGKAMGKRFSTLWTPIRMATAAAFLAPTVKGLSILQVLILMCLGWSVNFSNYLWGIGLDFLADHPAQVSVQVGKGVQQNTLEIAEGLLQSLVVLQHRNLIYNEPTADGRPFRRSAIEPTKSAKGYRVIQINSPAPGAISDEAMGAVAIPCLDLDSRACTVREQAAWNLAVDLQGLATDIVRHQALQGDPPRGARFYAAVRTYVSTVMPVLDQVALSENAGFERDLKGFASKGKADGWISAGSYYWTVARYAEKTHEILGDMPEYRAMNETATRSLRDSQAEASLVTAHKIANYDKLDDRMNIARSGTGGGAMQAFRDLTWTMFGHYTLGYFAKLMTDGDPIANFAGLGHSLITTAEAGAIGLTTAKAVAAGASAAANEGFWGTVLGVISGNSTTFVGKSAHSALESMWAVGMFLCLPIFTLGLTLAYYLPSLPFILWMAAVVGWLILVVETLFAAPLWAAAHAIPEGEGLAGQHGRQGYMLLLGVMARPPLMMGGYFVALLLIGAFSKVIGGAFMLFAAGASAETTFGLVSVVAYLFLLGGMMVVMAHKVFGLITHLPNNVIRWAGGLAHDLGEVGDEARTRAIFGAAVQKVGTGDNAGNQNRNQERSTAGDGAENGARIPGKGGAVGGLERAMTPGDSGTGTRPPSGRPDP